MNIKKHRILTLLSLMMCGISLMAQIQLTGVVRNSKTDSPIEFASAVLLKSDSTVVRGTTTDSVGRFKLNVPAVGEYLLKVSYIGYQPSVKGVAFATDSTLLDMGIVSMTSTDNALKTAVVTGTAARVEQKEDTTVFNASAYRTPEGSTLEALVKQFPGVEVSDDGKITWNGKEVKELLVNGKDFFKGDKNVAMKNLPVEMVNRIKAYDKASDYTEMTGIDDGEESTVLDIMTKRQLNQSWVTNLDLAYGTEGRYSAKAFATRFTDQTSITAFGALNNVGDRGFGGPRGFGGGGQGLTATKNAGLNFTWENKKAKKEAGRLELNGSAQYNHTSTDLIKTSASETFLAAGRSNSFSNSYSKSDNSSTRVNVNARLRWLPDTMTTIMLRPNYSYSAGRNASTSRTATFNSNPYGEGAENPLDSIFASPDLNALNPYLAGILVNKNLRDNMGDNESHNVGLNLNMVRRIGSKGRNVSLRARGNYSQSKNNSYSISDIKYGQGNSGRNQFLAQRSISPSQSYDYNVRVGYTEPIIKNLFAEANYTYAFKFNDSERTRDTLLTSQLNTLPTIGMLPTEADSLQWARDWNNSQYATYRYYNHTANIGLRYNSQAITANLGVDFNPERTKMQYNRPGQNIDTTIVRNVFKVAPQLRFRYKFSKTTNLDIRYRGSSSQPSMTNLLAVVDDSDPLNISMGNPGLKPSWNNNLRVSYHGYNPERQQGIVGGVDMTQTSNSISNLMLYDEKTGVRYTRPENINGNWNARGHFMFNSGLGEKKLFNISTATMLSYNNSVGYVRSESSIPVVQNPTLEHYNAIFNAASPDKSITRTVGVGENLNASYRTSWFDVGLLGSLNYQHSNSTLQSYNNMDTWNFAYGANANFNFDFGLSLSTDIRMNSRRGYADQAMNTNELLWNAQISYAFLKNRSAVVMLQAYDILRQQSNVSRVINAMQRSDSWTNAINSYFMLHFVYKLNIFSGGKSGENANKQAGKQQGPGMGRGQMPAGHPPVGGMPRGALYQAPTIYTR